METGMRLPLPTATTSPTIYDHQAYQPVLSSPSLLYHTTYLMSRNPRQHGHDLMLNNHITMTYSTSQHLDEDLVGSGLLDIDVDKLKGLVGVLLDGGFVSLGEGHDGR